MVVLRRQVLFLVQCNDVEVRRVTKSVTISIISCCGAVTLDVVTVVSTEVLDDYCELHGGKLLFVWCFLWHLQHQLLRDLVPTQTAGA